MKMATRIALLRQLASFARLGRRSLPRSLDTTGQISSYMECSFVTTRLKTDPITGARLPTELKMTRLKKDPGEYESLLNLDTAKISYGYYLQHTN